MACLCSGFLPTKKHTIRLIPPLRTDVLDASIAASNKRARHKTPPQLEQPHSKSTRFHRSISSPVVSAQLNFRSPQPLQPAHDPHQQCVDGVTFGPYRESEASSSTADSTASSINPMIQRRGSFNSDIPRRGTVHHPLRLIILVALDGAPFDLFNSVDFRELCKQLNPVYSLPCTETLQRKLDNQVSSMRVAIRSYIHQHIRHCSVTADSWTGRDQRKFLGITFHCVTRGYDMATIVIGMERIESLQTSARLPETFSKY